MKIVKNNAPKITVEPVVCICYWCTSELELDADDIVNGDMIYSQREIDRYVQGFYCPCCKNFTTLRKKNLSFKKK